jgi:tetratricopeptide (TPR) repeat protein
MMIAPAYRLRTLRFCRIALIAFGALFVSIAAAQSDDYNEAARLFKQGSYPAALDKADAAIKANPRDARARFLKGLILTEQNKQVDAIKVFQSLAEDYPELPEPYNNLAVLYASQGQYDKARTALEMAIRTHPSYATAHENLGDIYAKMASQAYDKALALDKSNASAQTKLNLIKDLFSTSAPRAKPVPAAAKTDGKAPAVVIATAPTVSVPPPAAPAPPVPPVAEKAPAPAPKAAEKAPAVAAKTEVPKAADGSTEALRAVNNWAKAWAGNDVDGYLAAYSPDFKIPKGESRADWENTRRVRIAKPRKIEVAVEAPKVTQTADNRVAVTFRQNYRSGGTKMISTKTLVLVKNGGRWLIQEERIGG